MYLLFKCCNVIFQTLKANFLTKKQPIIIKWYYTASNNILTYVWNSVVKQFFKILNKSVCQKYTCSVTYIICVGRGRYIKPGVVNDLPDIILVLASFFHNLSCFCVWIIDFQRPGKPDYKQSHGIKRNKDYFSIIMM